MERKQTWKGGEENLVNGGGGGRSLKVLACDRFESVCTKETIPLDVERCKSKEETQGNETEKEDLCLGGGCCHSACVQSSSVSVSVLEARGWRMKVCYYSYILYFGGCERR